MEQTDEELWIAYISSMAIQSNKKKNSIDINVCVSKHACINIARLPKYSVYTIVSMLKYIKTNGFMP